MLTCLIHSEFIGKKNNIRTNTKNIFIVLILYWLSALSYFLNFLSSAFWVLERKWMCSHLHLTGCVVQIL